MKKVLFPILALVLALGLALPMAAVVGASPDPGLVGLWHFDGDATDSSGNDNDGTVYGVETYVASPMGQALSFDGSSNYVVVPDDATLDGMSALTVEAWVRINSAGSGYKGIVDKTAGSGNRSYNIGLRNGKLEWGVANASNSKVTITAPTTAPVDTWIHVAGTYDGTNMYLYINGSPVSGTQTGTVQDSATDLMFGRWPGSSSSAYFFNGLIDEVRIWDEALTVDEIGLDLFDITVNAEGSALEVPIDWAYGEPYVSSADTTGTDTTEFILESIIEGTELTLTALDATHTNDYSFYVFDHWSWSVDGTTSDTAEEDFTITQDTTITAHYTKVISVDKTLEECYLGRLIETVTVPADSSSGATSNATLEDGKTYWLKASGTFNAAASITADAEYSSGPTSYVWQEPVENYESHGSDLLDLKVNDEFVDWGAYNPSHVYWTSEEGTGGPLKFTFSIYDLEPYSNNSGSLTVEIWEGGTGEACDPDAVPLGTVVSFGMTITVHAWDDLTPDTDIYVEDGIGADLVVDDPAIGSHNGLEVWKAGKGKNKMSATKIGWTIDDPEVCEDYTLDIVVYTGLNPKDKQEYTSTGEHELNSGPEVWFTYNDTLYMLQGPEIIVTVVD